MKNFKKRVKKRELMKLQLIKSDTYKKVHLLKNLTVEEINCRLKKSLRIIYYYHTNNKRLLFIGGSKEESEHLSNYFRRTKHMFISQTKWINGIINNRNMQLTISRDAKPKLLTHDVRDIIKLRNKFDLFVITDEKLNYQALIESAKLKVPIIALNSDISPFNSYVDFKTPGSLMCHDNLIKTNFFFALLKSIVFKGDRLKKRCPYVTHNLKKLALIEKKRYAYDRRPKWVKVRSIARKYTEKVWLHGKKLCSKFFKRSKSQKKLTIKNGRQKGPVSPTRHTLNWTLFNRRNYKNTEKNDTFQEKLSAKKYFQKPLSK